MNPVKGATDRQPKSSRTAASTGLMADELHHTGIERRWMQATFCAARTQAVQAPAPASLIGRRALRTDAAPPDQFAFERRVYLRDHLLAQLFDHGLGDDLWIGDWRRAAGEDVGQVMGGEDGPAKID